MNTKTIAEKHGFSESIVDDLLAGLRRTHGKQVQFFAEELGGMGQWAGGMTQIGRMGDAELKARVAALFCAELAQAVTQEPEAQTPSEPQTAKAESHGASSAGLQNGVRYAYYAGTHHLQIEQNGETKTYDTKGHAITGVAQGQGTGEPQTLRFTTTGGDTVGVEDFEPVAG
ncbi:MAG: hypothetical protein H7Y38_15625 [Armatimonadetes bacterium]|nr:hypothetical protein [Armatimonadota bacterium]